MPLGSLFFAAGLLALGRCEKIANCDRCEYTGPDRVSRGCLVSPPDNQTCLALSGQARQRTISRRQHHIHHALQAPPNPRGAVSNFPLIL
ncbi:MAG: hypothetical protein GY850_30035 [bacterium]|nr:hypothetical protein [bacterium]